MNCSHGPPYNNVLNFSFGTSRAGTLHARAEELQREDGVEAVIELQSADQTVVGRAMRGSGVVYCEAGRSILARTLALVREAMESM